MTAELIHVRGACWLTIEDYQTAMAEVAAAPGFTPNQRERLRTLLTPVDKRANAAAERHAGRRSRSAEGAGKGGNAGRRYEAT